MARIERKLNQFMEELRKGKREGSAASSVAENNEDDEGESWLQLRRELEDIGVSSAVLSQHKTVHH